MRKCSVHFVKDRVLAMKTVPIKITMQKWIKSQTLGPRAPAAGVMIITEFKLLSFVWGGKKKKDFKNTTTV